MLTASDLVAEIEKYEQRDCLSAQDCVQLAAFYTLLNTPALDQTAPEEHTHYSFTYNGGQPNHAEKVAVDGESDFILAINGLDSSAAWAVMDELMDTLQAINPRLYAGVMRKING